MKVRKLDAFPEGKECCLCHSSEADESTLGWIYTMLISGCRSVDDEDFSDITVHFFCLLMASRLRPRGSERHGLMGFLPQDIYKEIQRGESLKCTYCKKTGATVNCCVKDCTVKFHFTCGIKNHSMHNYKHIKSYCVRHRPKQYLPESMKTSLSDTDNDCILCYDSISANDEMTFIWPTCCKPTALLHRQCLQRMALNSGFYFKCPFCSNRREFCHTVKERGVYIPLQAASWEREPNAYQELNSSLKCEAERCLCDKGREFKKKNSRWELIPCASCGGNGIHLECANLWTDRKYNRNTINTYWDCFMCCRLAKGGNGEQEAHAQQSNTSHQVTVIDDDSDDTDDDVLIVENEKEEHPVPLRTDSIGQGQTETVQVDPSIPITIPIPVPVPIPIYLPYEFNIVEPHGLGSSVSQRPDNSSMPGCSTARSTPGCSSRRLSLSEKFNNLLKSSVHSRRLQVDMDLEYVLPGSSTVKKLESGTAIRGPGLSSIFKRLACRHLNRGPGGSSAIRGPGGSSAIRGPGDSSAIRGPGGSSVISALGGGVGIRRPAGSSAIRGPGGSSAIRGPGGSSAIRGPGGSSASNMPGCSTTISAPGRSSVISALGGGVGIRRPAGSSAIRGPGGSSASNMPGCSTTISAPGRSSVISALGGGVGIRRPAGSSAMRGPGGSSAIRGPGGSSVISALGGGVGIRRPAGSSGIGGAGCNNRFGLSNANRGPESSISTRRANITSKRSNVLQINGIIPPHLVDPNKISDKVIIMDRARVMELIEELKQHPYVDPDVIVID